MQELVGQGGSSQSGGEGRKGFPAHSLLWGLFPQPPLISILIKPLAPVCNLFICHSALGITEDSVLGVKEEGSNLCLHPTHILIQAINISVLRHIHS